MDRSQFYSEFESKFETENGHYKKEGHSLVFRHGNYDTVFDENRDFVRFDFDPDQPYDFNFRNIINLGSSDPKRHFHAWAIGEMSGGDEIVVIEEPGPFEGHVFFNFHDEDLFSLDTLDEDYENDFATEEEWAIMTPSQRIVRMSLFENLLALSLDEFFSKLVEEPK